MAEPITTRPLQKQDVESVLELLRAALGEPPLLRRTPELFAWKHFSNPFGESLALVAESGGQIVGLRALMRWELRTDDGSTLRCVRAVDTATHPDHHRRGIFRRLTEEAIEAAEADGVDLVFNTPNAKSGAGYLSMGWVEVGSIGVLARPSWRFLAKRPSVGAQEDAGLFMSHPTPVMPLTVGDRQPLGLRTPRTEDYLKWRYASHPTARYFRVDRGESVAVVRPNIRNGRRELIVVDAFGGHAAAVIRRAARKSKSAYLVAWFSRGSPERRAAIRSGLLPVPGLAPLTLMARPLRELPVDVSSMATWDLALSDLELL